MNEDARLSLAGDEPLLIRRRAGAVLRRELIGRASALAESLPHGAYAINLCQNQEAFIIGFLAALLRAQTNLLPPNRTRGTVLDVGRRFGAAVYAIAEEPLEGLELLQRRLDLRTLEERSPRALDVAPDHVAAIAFTSGTTGEPRANPKTWRSLSLGAELAARRFPFRGSNILATVPPQHMYGLETSIMVPLLAGAAVHESRPLFPQDLADALADMPAPRILITTPIHLRACIESGCALPPLELIISATAPLSATLAGLAESAIGAPVLEIYGCTEAGSVASRRTLDGDLWSPYDGVRLVKDGAAPIVAGGHLDAPVELADVLEADPSGGLRIVGRHVDMVSVAGKRASLNDLTWRLKSIDGVEDGVFVQPEGSAGDRVERLAALFVSSTLSEREVLERLHEHVDRAFLPRPIARVEALPRNELGKLPRAELLALLRRIRRPVSP